MASESLRGKRRHGNPPQTGSPKRICFQFYLLPSPTPVTPKEGDGLQLAQAGLGMKRVSLPEDAAHPQISDILCAEYPKLQRFKGAWNLYKAAGGRGRRPLTIINPSADGYTTSQLKKESHFGRIMLYIVPSHGELDTSPVTNNTFELSIRATCGNCQESMPAYLLSIHADVCTGNIDKDIEDEYEDSDVYNSTYDETDSGPSPYYMTTDDDDDDDMNSSPWSCSTCSDMHSRWLSGSEEESDTTDTPQEDWRTVEDPKKALRSFSKELLRNKNYCEENRFVVDLRKDQEEQDCSYMSFYKRENVEWASPLRCRLEGDIAMGTGVNRHVMSTLMDKLRTGFHRDFANGPITKIFEGQPDHLVPTSSYVMVESELFLMAGRMLGHCFLYGSPGFPGLSPAIKHVLFGGSEDTVTVTHEDCANIDFRETIQLLEGNSELVGEQRDNVFRLCMAWDFPPPTPTNRRWLHERMLFHAVLGRSERQVKQLRKGLKETGIWPLLSSRADVVELLFPCEKDAEITPQMILSRVRWPSLSPESDDEYDASIGAVVRVTTYFRTFIEHASSDQLKQLLRFWVGWESPPQELTVRVASGRFPRALTCSETIKLPDHYTNYSEFESIMFAAIDTCDTGFGLV